MTIKPGDKVLVFSTEVTDDYGVPLNGLVGMVDDNLFVRFEVSKPGVFDGFYIDHTGRAPLTLDTYVMPFDAKVAQDWADYRRAMAWSNVIGNS